MRTLLLYLAVLACASCAPHPIPLKSRSEPSTRSGVSLIGVAALGDISQLDSLVALGGDVNERTDKLFTPLHAAVIEERSEAVAFLLDRGARPNVATTADGCPLLTPLHFAALRTDSQVVTLLIQHGAILESPDAEGRTPLNYAVGRALVESPSVVSALIEGGADINGLDGLGLSPLYLAVRAGNVECAQLLMEAGAQVLEYQGSAEASYLTAECYHRYADFLRNAGDVQRSRDCYGAAREHYAKAADLFGDEIRSITLRREGRAFLGAASMLAASAAAQYKAEQQAKSMAQISALASPDGQGVGYGYAEAPYYLPDLTDDDRLKAAYKEMEQKSKLLSKQCAEHAASQDR